MVPTEWRRPSQSEHLLQQSCWQGPLTVRRKLAVFFEADLENPAYLSQLLLQAGDVERNPGPVACGICSRKVTSNSIKYAHGAATRSINVVVDSRRKTSQN